MPRRKTGCTIEMAKGADGSDITTKEVETDASGRTTEIVKGLTDWLTD